MFAAGYVCLLSCLAGTNAMMGSVKFKNLDSRSLVFLLILVTVAVSIFLYQSTKCYYSQPSCAMASAVNF